MSHAGRTVLTLRTLIAPLPVGVLATALLVSLVVASQPPRSSASHAGGMDAMSIDMDTTGNTATALGSIENCARLNANGTLDADEDSIDVLELDVTAQGIPASNPMIAFNFEFKYPAGQVSVQSADTAFLLAAAPGSILFDLSDTQPDADGVFLGAVADIGFGAPEAGSGVLSRFSLGPIPTGQSGLYSLSLKHAAHIDDSNEVRLPGSLNNAAIAIDTTCGPIPPPPIPPSAIAGLAGDVAIGDLDGDLNPDVVSTLVGADAVSVLMGNGDGTFEPFETYFAGNGPVAVSLSDMNQDGILDVVTANQHSGDVSVLLGMGDGSLSAPLRFSTGSSFPFLVVVDLDGDLIPDVVSANLSGDLFLLRGAGDGTLSLVQVVPSTNRNLSVTAGTMNGDSFADIVVGSVAGVSVYLGNGDGTVGPQQLFASGAGASGVSVGDVDGDHSLDVATGTADGASSSVGVLLGAGDGTLQPPQFFPSGIASDLALADFNGDGTLDVVTVNVRSDNVSLLIGNGNGSFQPALWFEAGEHPLRLAVGDLNRNGQCDIVTSSSILLDPVGAVGNCETPSSASKANPRACENAAAIGRAAAASKARANSHSAVHCP